MKDRLSRIASWFRERTPATQARLVLACLATGLAAQLIFGDKPWEVTITPEKKMKTGQYAAIYFWLASLGNLVVIGMLAATASWWTKPMTVGPKPAREPIPRAAVALVIAAMLAGGILAWPRMGQSFWHDESDRIGTVIVGTYRQDDSGKWEFRSLPWRETIFYYKVPNHVLQSIMSRLSNDTWRTFAKPEGLQFSETAIRLPGFVAGILSIAALAFLMARLGYPSPGVAAAWLMAVHPWFLRYATEARAYNYVLLFIPLFFLALMSIWERGWLRAWIAFAVLEFLLMYVYPTSAFVLAAANLLLVVALWMRWGWRREFFIQSGRWIIANIVAAMAFLQMMLPCIPQFLEYVTKTSGQGELGLRWLKNVGGFFLAGVPWSYSFLPVSDFLELWPWAEKHPMAMNAIILGTMVALMLGGYRLLRSGVPAMFFAITLPVAAVVCVFESKVRGGYLFEWYVIFLLPAAVTFFVIGLWEIAKLLPRWRTPVFAGLTITILSLYIAWTTPQRDFLRAQSLQPYRESVMLTRPNLDPLAPLQNETITATFYSKPFPYDPRIVLFKNGVELGDLVRKADAEGKKLFINLGFLVTVQGEHPHKYKFLKESGFFDDLGIIPGFMETLGRHVFRYRPGSAAGFDFSSIPHDRGRSNKDMKTPAVDIGGGHAYNPMLDEH